MSQVISSVLPSWASSPLTYVRNRWPRKSHPVTSPGPSGAIVSEPFTRSIEPKIGVAEVVQSEVVADRVAADVVARFGR